MKQSEIDSQNRVALLVLKISMYCRDSSNISVLKIEGSALTMWCGFKEYKVLVVDEDAPKKDHKGYDFIADTLPNLLAFFRKRHNEFLKDVEANGSEKQKRALGLVG
jgi:hypothetical protein